MKENINIAELLKDCPSGMKLDCALFEGLEFDSIIANSPLPIRCRILNPDGRGYNIYHFTKYGCWNDMGYAKCVIFPKGKDTWDEFIPSCKFKAGDVLVSKLRNIVLFSHIDSKNIVHYHCIIPTYGSFRIEKNTSVGVGKYYDCVLANEQQRQRMYDKIKCSGYKYNQQLNKLERLIKPKFNVGDKITKIGGSRKGIILYIDVDKYHVAVSNTIAIDVFFEDQDNWKLVPNKFDINTLKPFDKVLCRDSSEDIWTAGFYSHYETQELSSYHVVNGTGSDQCIPYEGNEHLLGTNDDCNEYYKTWE